VPDQSDSRFSVVEIIQCRMKWEDDHEWWVGMSWNEVVVAYFNVHLPDENKIN
jgi:hypothetical protein